MPVDHCDVAFAFERADSASLRVTPIGVGVLYEEQATTDLYEATRLPSKRVDQGNLSEWIGQRVFFLKTWRGHFAKFRIDWRKTTAFNERGEMSGYGAFVSVEYFYYKSAQPDFSLHKTIVP